MIHERAQRFTAVIGREDAIRMFREDGCRPRNGCAVVATDGGRPPRDERRRSVATYQVHRFRRATRLISRRHRNAAGCRITRSRAAAECRVLPERLLRARHACKFPPSHLSGASRQISHLRINANVIAGVKEHPPDCTEYYKFDRARASCLSADHHHDLRRGHPMRTD